MSRLLPLAVLCCLLVSASATAAPTQSLSIEAPRDLLNPTTRPAAFAELQSLGVKSLRVVLTWSFVAPAADQPVKPEFDATDPAAYDWGEYDQLMAGAQALGWPVLVTISGPVPKWATQAKLDTFTRPDPLEFQAFVTAVGRHYGDQVSTWAVWNEPNQPQFLRPQFAHGGKATSPGLYRQLFLAARRGLDASGQGADRVLIGETSPRGTGRVVAPLTFLRTMFCLTNAYERRGNCTPLNADGYAHHAYTTRQGPYFDPPSKNDVTIGVLSRLTTALDRVRAAGAVSKRLPVYLTEFGIQSTPDTQSGVSLAKQVEYRAISERIAYANPRVIAFSQYLLRDSDPTGTKQYGGFESGLRFADGRAKPALAGFRLPLAVRRQGLKASVWGLVRPANVAAAPAATTVTITYADRGATSFKPLRTVRTDGRGYFKFTTNWRKGRRWNVTWQNFGGAPVGAYER